MLKTRPSVKFLHDGAIGNTHGNVKQLSMNSTFLMKQQSSYQQC